VVFLHFENRLCWRTHVARWPQLRQPSPTPSRHAKSFQTATAFPTASPAQPPPGRATATMPDLNSVPPSPHPRRASTHQMPPPPVPGSSLDILPSNQIAVNNAASTAPNSSLPHPPPAMFVAAAGDNTGVGPGPGPVRHPRPLTAADLHLQLEKEQEAVVCWVAWKPCSKADEPL
jgi:hypothetical protein